MGPIWSLLWLTHWGRDKMADIYQSTFSNAFFQWKFVWIWIKISLKFVPKGPVNNIPTLVQIMAWRRPAIIWNKMVRLPTHMWVTWPQWVNIAQKIENLKKFALYDLGPVLLKSHRTVTNFLTNGSTVFIWKLWCHWLKGLWIPSICLVTLNEISLLDRQFLCMNGLYKMRERVLKAFSHLEVYFYTPAQQSWRGVYWIHLVRPSVRPSVCRRHGFRSISQVSCGIFISNFICMLMVAIGRSLLIFSDITFKKAAWRPYWIFWFPDSNFTLALNINFKLQRHNTYVYG